MMASRQQGREDASDGSFCELPDWNQALKASQDFNCSPAKLGGAVQGQLKDARAATRTYGVGRVRAGAQPAAAPQPNQQRAWRLEDAGTLRAGGLDKLPNAREAEFWLRRAAAEQEAGNPAGAVQVLQEALQRDVRPTTSIVRALAALQKGNEEGGAAPPPDAAVAHDRENNTQAAHPPAVAAEQQAPHTAQRTARKAFTPSKTGLTGKAQRLPSRFAKTPGGALPVHDAAAGPADVAGGACASKFTGVLKKLSFTAAKPQEQQQQLAAGVPPAATTNTASRVSVMALRSSAVSVGAAGPHTTAKHLRFDSRATPAATTAGKARHVTFDASTVSPAARAAALQHQPSTHPATPEPPIPEEEGSGSSLEGASTACTTNAGRTPFDKRLSSLFRKYAPDGTPCEEGLGDDMLDDLEGALRSPSWNRLSTVSVPDSIKILSQKYTSDTESLAGLSPPLAATPVVSISAVAAIAAAGDNPATPGSVPSTSSPATVAATPHDKLPGFLTRNQAYESPESALAAGVVPAAGTPPASTPVPAGTPVTAAAAPGEQAQQLTPNTAIARLLGPMLRATIEEIEVGKAAAAAAGQQEQQVEEEEMKASTGEAPGAGAAAGPAADASTMLLRSSVSPLSGAVHLTPGFPVRGGGTLPLSPMNEAESPLPEGGDSDDIDLTDASPLVGGEAKEEAAEFGGFPAMAPAATPDITLPSPDGVPRDAFGVPKFTPATVTVRRGHSSGGSASPLLAAGGGDGLAANLLSSFESPTESELRQQEVATVQRRKTAAQAATPTPAAAGDDGFSFFPTAAATNAQQGTVAATPASVDADTPNMQLPGGSAAQQQGFGRVGGMMEVSPEILGFFESQQQERQEQQNQEAAEPARQPEEKSAPATAAKPSLSPLLPRSILKSGRLRNKDGTPVLGRAQRVTPQPAEEAAAVVPPHTITKELQALMAGLSLQDRESLAQRGSLPTLSPVRTGGLHLHLEIGEAAAASGEGPLAALGAGGLAAKVITPVRRSARNRAPHKPLEAMLEETGYSYVPNSAMMLDEEALPKKESAAKSAKKASSSAGARAAATAGQSEVSSGHQQQEQQATPQAAPSAAGASSGTASRRYSTRSAVRRSNTSALQAEQQTAKTPASTQRAALQALRTPTQMAHTTETAVATPAAAPVVADDASPVFAVESPNAFAATTPATGGRYSLRPSTLRKSMTATPGAARTPLAANNSGAKQTPAGQRATLATAAQAVKLSPTEASIRSSLRRSARKSMGMGQEQ